MESLRARIDGLSGRRLGGSTIRLGDDFSYTDPVDHRVTTRQGIRLLFEDDSRIVYRLSGTGSSAATLRIYLEHYEPDVRRHGQDVQSALADLAAIAREFAELSYRFGDEGPSVIT